MRRRQLGTVALVAALALGAAGCGEDSPKPGPVAESRQSSNIQPPSYPNLAHERTASGAQEFVRYYVSLINYAQSSGRVNPLKELTSSNCSGCNVVIKKIESVYASRGTITGIEWQVGNLSFKQVRGKAVVVGQVSMAAGSIEPSSEASTITDYKEVPARETQFGLKFASRRWMATDLVQP